MLKDAQHLGKPRPEGTQHQAEGTARTEAQRQEHAWHVGEATEVGGSGPGGGESGYKRQKSQLIVAEPKRKCIVHLNGQSKGEVDRGERRA